MELASLWLQPWQPSILIRLNRLTGLLAKVHHRNPNHHLLTYLSCCLCSPLEYFDSFDHFLRLPRRTCLLLYELCQIPIHLMLSFLADLYGLGSDSRSYSCNLLGVLYIWNGGQENRLYTWNFMVLWKVLDLPWSWGTLLGYRSVISNFRFITKLWLNIR